MRLARIILLFMALISSTAYGSEGATPSPFSADFLFRVINAVILFGGIGYAISKPLKNYLKERSENVKNAIMEAKKAKEEAEKKARYYDEKLSALESEIKAMMDEYKRSAEEERERIIREYNEQIQKLKERMAKSIEQEKAKLREELMIETANMAVQVAEEMIRKNFTPQDQKKLVQEYIKMMERVN
ncbi:MAG: ATP synthase F0 subunit B [Proteobacteria bacterium]|nr:ATP synthase F0 subunit B [Pseudomonadota bacterium]